MPIWNVINLINMDQEGRSRMAQSVKRPSKVPVWCNSTDVGSIPGCGIGVRRKKTWFRKTKLESDRASLKGLASLVNSLIKQYHENIYSKRERSGQGRGLDLIASLNYSSPWRKPQAKFRYYHTMLSTLGYNSLYLSSLGLLDQLEGLE